MLKHGARGEVAVVLVRTRQALTVRVSSPYGDRPVSRAPGSGAGLVGMRERTALLDGEFEAGPVAGHEGGGDGGGKSWQVRAVLPIREEDGTP